MWVSGVFVRFWFIATPKKVEELIRIRRLIPMGSLPELAHPLLFSSVDLI